MKTVKYLEAWTNTGGLEAWERLPECGSFETEAEAEAFIEKLKDGTAFAGRDADDREMRVA